MLFLFAAPLLSLLDADYYSLNTDYYSHNISKTEGANHTINFGKTQRFNAVDFGVKVV